MMYPILESQSDSENNKIASPVDHTSPSIKRNNDYNSDSLKININNGNNNNGGSNGVTTSSSSSGEPNLPYPGFPEISLKYLTQDTRPRNWCLWLITNPYVLNTWFGRISILVVLLNCITLGMKQPCVDKECVTNQCRMLQSFDHIIFLFFSLEMIIKMIAMGVSGKNSYLTDVWNRLDFLFVLVGAFEYCVAVNNLHFTIYLFIRIIRVLSPLRAISRIPSMRILVMPLLDSLPKLGNVLLLYFFVFLIFGIIGVQLWEGILRQRCAMQLPQNVHNPGFTIPFFYDFSMEQDYICSKTEDSGMHDCVNLPRYRIGSMICNDPALPANANNPTENGCVNWNQYYTKCEQLGSNPSQGKISFDNIGLAWVAISLVISLEGWSDIMYYVQDAHSFWVWIYFVLLIVIGSFFMISLFLIVIATQFSITKNRERDRIRHQERAIFASTSSSTTNKYQKQQRIDGLHEFVTPIYKVLSNIFCCMLKSVCRIVELLSFFLLLLLFIFIFSILGMDLFGCKSCENIEDTKPCDRQNFGSLLWASVTVFQILTQGEWKAVLFNQMEKNSHWSSLYFVTLMTFGNYVLFNLLVAILVDGFRSKRNKMREQRELLKAKSCEEHFSVKLNDLMAENLRHSAEELRKSNLIRGNNGQSKKLSQDSPNPTLDSESSIKHWENRSLEEIDKPLYGSIPLLLKPRSVLTSLKTIDDRICLDLVPTPITHNKNETNGMTETNINNSFNPEIEKLQALSETDLNKLNQKSSSNVNLPEHDGSTKSSEHNCCRETYSLYMFPPKNRFRQICIWLVHQKWFDNAILLFIVLNCITLAMEGPNYMPLSTEGFNLATANYIFTVIFAIELFIKVIAAGMFYGPHAYFRSGWNIMDGLLIIISIIDLLMSLISPSPRILKVFRLLRSLRPLRVINGVHGLKLVVQTLLSSLRPIGNILLICCAFFIIFGILGIQLFKGTFYRCQGDNVKGVRNKTECFTRGDYWVNEEYNFDNLGKALLSLFVLWSRDGWVNIVYTGLDAVGVDQQPIVNYNEWRLLYFIAFILLVGFFVLHMFVGVAVENFHRYCEKQKREEKIKRPAKEALQMGLHEPPYYSNYSSLRLFVHNVVTSKYFDLAIAAVIGLNVVTMTMEYYMMPVAFYNALEIFNYFITVVLLLEAIMKLVALGIKIYMKDKWNQLDVVIVILSILEIILENLERINPKIIRVMRVLRIARVLKLLKMAKGIRALLDTVLQALLQVGNLGLLLFLLFFIFAQLGVELYGQLECSDEKPCHGLGEHAHFENFGMAFLTLLRVATRDNWNDIMKDTLRDQCDDSTDCVNNCCVNTVIAKIFFVVFVLMTQFVLVNVVVAVLMKHLEESHKQMEETMDISDNNSKTVPIGSQKLPVHGLDSVAVTNDRLL